MPFGLGRGDAGRPVLPSLPAQACLCALLPQCLLAASCLLSESASPRWVFVCGWVCRRLGVGVGVGSAGASLGTCLPWGPGLGLPAGPPIPEASLPRGARGLPAPQALSGFRPGSVQGDVLSGVLGWGSEERRPPFP